MPVKVYVSNREATAVAKRLLSEAAEFENPQDHVRVEKTRGFGFVVSDELAKKLGLKEGATASVDGDDVKVTTKTAEEPDSVDDSEAADKPKRGRPAGSGKKVKEQVDGE